MNFGLLWLKIRDFTFLFGFHEGEKFREVEFFIQHVRI